MNTEALNIVILGLSITSSWGNGHATTFRGLANALHQRGHNISFLERNKPWYANARDLPDPTYCKTILYDSIEELTGKYSSLIANADLVIVGSYVPEGVAVGKLVIDIAGGVTAFYDIDTPITLSKLECGDFEYLHPSLIADFDMYLSFTGGPILQKIGQQYGSPMVRHLYCSFDPELYFPEPQRTQWDLGYLGTYSSDRQPSLEKLLLDPAKRFPQGKFVVAGPLYPSTIKWPKQVQRIEHLPPSEHRHFYKSQRFTLNITRSDMIRAGYAPSVRLFEAAACGTPIITDYWEGIESIFEPGKEILIAHSAKDCQEYLKDIPGTESKAIGENACIKVMSMHTAAHRATELENFYKEALCIITPPVAVH
ncbi:MAG: glycosyltransferase [Bacteroidota bacterium]